MKYARILRYGGTIAIVSSALLFFSDRPLPEPSQVKPTVLQGQPLQREIRGRESFIRSYGDIVYTYTPRATYEISGVVVSLHHSDSFVDITHEYDPANTLDLCLAWGENVRTDAFRKVEYSHGDFTCFYRWQGQDPGFRPDEMSNTHIVPSSDALSRSAKNVRIGDQVTLRGTLVDYSTTFSGGRMLGTRATSLVRSDTGNGACEILYLEELSVLDRQAPWREPLSAVLFFGGLLSHILALILYIRHFRSSLPVHSEIRESPPSPDNPLDPRNYPSAAAGSGEGSRSET